MKLNNIQKLENKIVNYAITLGGVNIRNNSDYRQLRKGVRLTYKLHGEGLSYYEWLCTERTIWIGIKLSRQMDNLSTITKEEM